MKKLLCLLPLTVFLFASCKKEQDYKCSCTTTVTETGPNNYSSTESTTLDRIYTEKEKSDAQKKCDEHKAFMEANHSDPLFPEPGATATAETTCTLE